MYRVAQAANSSLKLFSASMLVEVSRLHIQALMPKGAGLRFFVNKCWCKVNAGVSGQTFVYPLKIAFYLYEYVTT